MPVVGALWFDSTGLQLYIFYTDTNGSQWVPTNNEALLGFLSTSGGTMTGPLVLPGSPTAPLQAAPKQYIDAKFSGYNKLINPFCEIDQAREGGAISITNAQQYIGDGHVGYAATTGGAAVSGGRGTGGPTGFQYHIGFTVTTAATSVGAGDSLQLFMPIEAEDIGDTQFGTSAAQPLTASFWAYATIAGTYAFSLRNGASARSYVAPFTVTANTWTFITITIPGDITGTWTTYGNAVGMYATFNVACGATSQAPAINTWASGNYFGLPSMNNAMMTTANSTFMIGPHKLELGSQASPIARQSFQQELARCQRYYEKNYDIGTAPGAAIGVAAGGDRLYVNATSIAGGQSCSFKVLKRAKPTITFYSPGSGTAGVIYSYTNSPNDVAVSLDSTGTTSMFWYASCTNYVNFIAMWVADARL